MKEATAKKHLGAIRRSFTTGTILHLLAELYREMADNARQQDDDQAVNQFQEVAAALFVVGLGIDAACPRK